MSTAHTPGPWYDRGAEVRSDAGEFPRIVCDPYAGQVENESGTRRRLMPIDEREANARLIAAAPELRDALADCVAQLDKETLGGPALDNARALLSRLT